MKIILIGAPGSGKGTVAGRLSQEYNIPHISTGQMFRKHIEEQTDFGKQISSFMQSGNLVPDQLVLEIVKQRISQEDCQKGYIFDGFPRTVNQAELFSVVENVDLIFDIDISDQEVYNRLALRQREDDSPAVIAERIEVYKNQTQPLKTYYASKIIHIDGEKSREEVYNQVNSFIKKFQKEVKKIDC